MKEHLKWKAKNMALSAVFIMVFAAILPGVNAQAAPANPEPFEFEQPDSQIITIVNRGDEFLHWTEDLNGNLLVPEGDSYYYATWTDDGPKATSIQASDRIRAKLGSKGSDIPASVLQNATDARNQNEAQLQSQSHALIQAYSDSSDEPVVNPNPERHLLIIHASYDDDPDVGSNLPPELKMDEDDIYNLVFGGAGTRSVNDYYMTMLGRSDDVILPAEVEGAQNGIMFVSLPGEHKGNYGDLTLGTAIVKEALQKAIDQRLNLESFAEWDEARGEYSIPPDKLVIGILIQGHDSGSGGGKKSVRGSRLIMGVTFGNLGSTLVNCFNAGTIQYNGGYGLSTIGVICHELGHAAYDFRDTYMVNDIFGAGWASGMGKWSLMAGGSNSRKPGERDGEPPSYIDAYNLVRSGLVKPGIISYDEYVTKTISDPCEIYKIIPKDSATQYFLLQQRKNSGFDSGVFLNFDQNLTESSDAGGLMIYHIDNNNNVNVGNGPLENNKRTHYSYGIEEAHGGNQHLQMDKLSGTSNSGDIGDLFGNGNNAFSMYTSPFSGLYSAFTHDAVPPTQTMDSGVNIGGISYSQGKTTFTINPVQPPINIGDTFIGYGITYKVISETEVQAGNGVNACVPTSIAEGITIPPSVRGYTVSGIGDNAFSDCRNITNITLPDSVTSIGGHAFQGCKKLTNITLPSSVTSVGDYTFSGCSDLTGVTFSDSLLSIGDFAFFSCSNLTNVRLPDGLLSVGNYAFGNCTSLASITLSFNVTSIGNDMFYNCTSLTDVTIPFGVTSIGSRMFNNCTSLTEITIPASVTRIEGYAFYNCTNLTSVIIPTSVTRIEYDVFNACSKLTIYGYAGSYAEQYALTNNIPFVALEVLKIGDTFVENGITYKVISETEVQVGDGENASIATTTTGEISIPLFAREYAVTGIGRRAFVDCRNLTGITIPSSVTRVDIATTVGCQNLKSINVDQGNTKYSSQDGVLFDKNKTVLIVYPVGQERTGYETPSSVTTIGDRAFMSCYTLTNIKLPQGLTRIENYAFNGCNNLTDITLPAGTVSIGWWAFSGCSNLTSATLPTSLTSIEYGAFNACKKLTEIVIPASVTRIDAAVFSSCDDLTIYGYAGSYAEQYALTNNIPFVALEVLKIGDTFVENGITYKVISETEVQVGDDASAIERSGEPEAQTEEDVSVYIAESNDDMLEIAS